MRGRRVHREHAYMSSRKSEVMSTTIVSISTQNSILVNLVLGHDT